MNAAWKFIKMKWILFYFGCHSDGSLMPEWPEIDHHGGCQYNSKKLVLVFALETKEFYNFEINHIVLPFNGFYDVYSKSWLKYIIKRGASSRWSFRPNSAWGRIETTTIAKTHPTLHCRLYNILGTLIRQKYQFINLLSETFRVFFDLVSL